MSNINSKLEFLADSFNEVSYIKPIKSGKEADVHLILVDHKPYALKVYKEHQKFSSRQNYININELGDSRKIRAVRNKSSKGVNFLSESWTQREVQIMKDVYDAGGNVPKIHAYNHECILMDFIGSGETPAARLIDTNLSSGTYNKIFNEIVQNILIFLDLGFVHGDLNEFNILYTANEIFVIDFPQMVWLKNPNSYQIFLKDLQSIEKFFSGKISSAYLLKTIFELKQEYKMIK